MVSSSAGMVLVSSRQGTVPFSFSSSIYGREMGLGSEAQEGQESPHKYPPPLNKWALWQRRQMLDVLARYMYI